MFGLALHGAVLEKHAWNQGSGLGLGQEGFSKDSLEESLFATCRRLVHKGYCGWLFWLELLHELFLCECNHWLILQSLPPWPADQNLLGSQTGLLAESV